MFVPVVSPGASQHDTQGVNNMRVDCSLDTASSRSDGQATTPPATLGEEVQRSSNNDRVLVPALARHLEKETCAACGFDDAEWSQQSESEGGEGRVSDDGMWGHDSEGGAGWGWDDPEGPDSFVDEPANDWHDVKQTAGKPFKVDLLFLAVQKNHGNQNKSSLQKG